MVLFGVEVLIRGKFSLALRGGAGVIVPVFFRWALVPPLPTPLPRGEREQKPGETSGGTEHTSAQTGPNPIPLLTSPLKGEELFLRRLSNSIIPSSSFILP